MKLSLAVLAVVLFSACSGAADDACQVPANLEHLPDLPGFGQLQLDQELCNRLNNTLLAAEFQLSKATTPGQRVEITGNAGRRLYAFGFLEQASHLFQLARSAAPEDFRFPFMLSLVEHQREGERTLDFAEAASDLNSEHPPLQALLARLHLQEGDLDSALALARRAIAGAPELAHARWTLAEIATRQESPEAVLEHTAAALEFAPEADLLHGLQARALTALSRHEEAKEAQERAGDQPPRLTGPWIATLSEIQFAPLSDLRFGMASMRRGHYSLALEALNRAHASDPTDPAVLLHLGRCRRLMGDERGALTAFQSAVELDSRYETWIALARALQIGEQAQEASAAYRQALQHRPEDKMARFWLAECLATEEELAEALALVEELLAEGFGSPGYLLASDIALRLGQDGRSREFLEAGIKAFPGDEKLAAARLISME